MSLSSQSFSIAGDPLNFASCWVHTHISGREEERRPYLKGNELVHHTLPPPFDIGKTRTCVHCNIPRYVCHPDRDFPQTPHDEILSSRHVRMQHTHISSPASCSQAFIHQAIATNKQYSPIQSRMHLHDTVSAPVANRTPNLCPEHFLLLIFQKACIPEPTGKPTCIVLYRGSISISFSFLPFSFYHSISTIWHHFHLASFSSHHHGARSTADGSRVMDGVECKCGTS